MKDQLIQEHPLIATATALGVGLLVPIGLKILAQQSTAWREDLDADAAAAENASEARHDGADQEFIYRHPLITTGVALGAVLLTPVGLNLLEQLQALGSKETATNHAPPEAASAQPPRSDAPPRVEPDRGGDSDASDEDFIHQHPFITTAAALGVGLLAPIGLNLMAQLQTARAEAAEATGTEREPARAKSQPDDAPPRSAADRGRDDDAPADDDVARQRAFMTNAAMLGVGLLAVLTLASQSWRRDEGRQEMDPETSGRSKPPERQRGRAAHDPASDGGARDVGALDMRFTTHRPGGKNIQLNFGWKKRPVDAPETGWPTDTMGFTLDLPDGKETTFTMARKSRPVPAGYGDVIRRGLGEAALEFVSRRPDDGSFRFTWEKTPPETAPESDAEPAGPPKGRKKAPAAKAERTEQKQKAAAKSASD